MTLAGVDDGPLRLDDALVSSLHAAYEAFGDPALPVVIGIRELLPLFVQARVAVLRDRDWVTVEAAIRRRLLDKFSFESRPLGQSAYLSEVTGAVQSVDGVEWVDVDLFGGISEIALRNKEALALAVASLQSQISPGPVQSVVRVHTAIVDADGQNMSPGSTDASRFLPAQLAFLLRDVPGTLVLNRA